MSTLELFTRTLWGGEVVSKESEKCFALEIELFEASEDPGTRTERTSGALKVKQNNTL